MIVVNVDQRGCAMLRVCMSVVGMMGDTDCTCEEACVVFLSVLVVVQVNVQRWG